MASSGSSPQLALGAIVGWGRTPLWLWGFQCCHFRLLSLLPLRSLTFLHLLPPLFHLRFPPLSLLAFYLRLLSVLGPLNLRLSPLLFPSVLPSPLALLLRLLLVFLFLFDSVLCSIFCPSLLVRSSFGSCFHFFCCFFPFSSSLRFICLFVFYAISWSLPAVVSCSAPSLDSLSGPAPSGLFHPLLCLLLQLFFCLILPSLPYRPLLLLLPFILRVLRGFLPLLCLCFLGVCASASGVLASDTPRDSFPFTGASGADFADPCAFCDCDDSSMKGEKDSPALGKSKSSKIFHRVVNLIMGFFPRAKSASPSSSSECFPWLDVVNMSQQGDPHIFLTLFEKLAAVSKEVSEKFRKEADGKKTTSSALPTWGDVYRLSNLPEFHEALKVSPVCRRRHLLLLVPSTCLSMRRACGG